MQYQQNRRLSKTATTRETRKPKAIRVPQLSVAFLARLKPNGKDATVYCRLTYNGQRSQFSTGVDCKRWEFKVKTLTVVGQPEQSALLVTMKANALKSVAQLRTFGQLIILDTVRQLTLGNTLITKQTPTLIQAFALFLERSAKEEQTGTIDRDTYKQHERWAKRVGQYFTDLYGPKCYLSDVKPSDGKDLQLALKLESRHGQNYSLKIVQFTKRVFNYGVECLWIERNPLMNFRGNRKPGKVEYLTEKELSRLAETTKLNPALHRVCSVFLFMAYTGLAWKDAEQLTSSDIGTHEETGVRFIEKARQKSGTPQIVPLLPQAERLLAKWKNDPVCKATGRLLPVRANQTMNNALKEIAAVVGIEKRLSTHMARRTFVTLFYEKGLSLKAVSTMAGHSNTAVTERHYLRVTPGQVIREMKVVFPELGTSDDTENEQAA